ncbi:MAG: DUF2071 domain-containing protein [Ignavibacteriaceae bacterium]
MTQPSIKDRLKIRQEPRNKLIVMHQDWRDLLFLHWEYDSAKLQRTLPEGLYVDTYNGRAYIGVIPFSLLNLRLNLLPPVPGISYFSEINVRTYVYDENGTPGVWFYSLDADKFLAVEAAKLIDLPYRHAEITNEKDPGNGIINFSVKRTGEIISSHFKYSMNGEESFADSESLEFFLIERYLLFNYSKEKNMIRQIQVHHNPYPIVKADLLQWDDKMLRLNGFEVTNRKPDHTVMSPGVDTKIYMIEKGK